MYLFHIRRITSHTPLLNVYHLKAPKAQLKKKGGREGVKLLIWADRAATQAVERCLSACPGPASNWTHCVVLFLDTGHDNLARASLYRESFPVEFWFRQPLVWLRQAFLRNALALHSEFQEERSP